MATDSTTLNENTRSTLDGTEWCRLATTGANWKAQLGTQNWVFGSIQTPLIAGGTAANSTLSLESTSGVGTSDRISFLTGSQVEQMRIDTNGNITNGGAVINTIFGTTPNVEFNDSNAILAMHAWNASTPTAAPGVYMATSKNATIGTQTALVQDDAIGRLEFGGSDGTVFRGSAAIRAYVDGTVLNNSVPGRLTFWTLPAPQTNLQEVMRIDNNGNVAIGNRAGPLVLDVYGNEPLLQLAYNGGTNINFQQFTPDATGPYLTFVKSRGNVTGTGVVAQNNDTLMYISAEAYDATGTPVIREGATIGAYAEGAPTAGSVPARLVWSTATSGSAPAERMRLDSQGRITIGGTANNQGYRVEVHGTVAGTTSVLGNFQWSADSNGGRYYFLKSRGSAIGTMTAVAANDELGIFNYRGADATATPVFRDAAQVQALVDGSPTAGSCPGMLRFLTAASGSSVPSERLRIGSTGAATFGVSFGYGLGGGGIGGTVTQATSRTTGVTLNKICGAITLFAAAPTVGTWSTFTVTNSTVAATDTIIVNFKSGTNTYIACVSAVASGSFNITFESVAGTTSDSPVINFAVVKAVSN